MSSDRSGRQAVSGWRAVADEAADAAAGFEVAFLDSGREVRRPLTEVRSVTFEETAPVTMESTRFSVPTGGKPYPILSTARHWGQPDVGMREKIMASYIS